LPAEQQRKVHVRNVDLPNFMSCLPRAVDIGASQGPAEAGRVRIEVREDDENAFAYGFSTRAI